MRRGKQSIQQMTKTEREQRRKRTEESAKRQKYNMQKREVEIRMCIKMVYTLQFKSSVLDHVKAILQFSVNNRSNMRALCSFTLFKPVIASSEAVNRIKDILNVSRIRTEEYLILNCH